jgi:hypothetical protein
MPPFAPPTAKQLKTSSATPRYPLQRRSRRDNEKAQTPTGDYVKCFQAERGKLETYSNTYATYCDFINKLTVRISETKIPWISKVNSRIR